MSTDSSVKATQPEREEEPFAGHAGPVSGVAVTPDGSQIITGGQDGMVRIWDITTGRQVAVLTGHTGPVLAVAVTPDGSQIITGGQDGMVRIWDRASVQQLEHADSSRSSLAARTAWFASGIGPASSS